MGDGGLGRKGGNTNGETDRQADRQTEKKRVCSWILTF